MVSRITGMVLGIGAVGVLVGALLFGLRPQAQEADESAADQVSQSELELYIDVYTAMQADHDLTLDVVLTQKGVPAGAVPQRRAARAEAGAPGAQGARGAERAGQGTRRRRRSRRGPGDRPARQPAP